MMFKPGRSGPRLLMVEVKCRRRCGFDGWGVRALTAAKRQRLARTLACWQSCHPWSEQGQLEVVLELMHGVTSERGPDSMLYEMVTRACELTNAMKCRVFKIDSAQVI